MKREVGSVPKLLYSRKDVASALSVSVRAVDYMIERGDMKTRKIGFRVLVPVGEVQRVARDGVKTAIVEAA